MRFFGVDRVHLKVLPVGKVFLLPTGFAVILVTLTGPGKQHGCYYANERYPHGSVL
jgi:hypothetical protein